MRRRPTRTRPSPSTPAAQPASPLSARTRARSLSSPRPITYSTVARPRRTPSRRSRRRARPTAVRSWPASLPCAPRSRTPATSYAPPGCTARTAATSCTRCCGWPGRARRLRWSMTSVASRPGPAMSPPRYTRWSPPAPRRGCTTRRVPGRRPGSVLPRRYSGCTGRPPRPKTVKTLKIKIWNGRWFHPARSPPPTTRCRRRPGRRSPGSRRTRRMRTRRGKAARPAQAVRRALP
jgi:hypothetical protein